MARRKNLCDENAAKIAEDITDDQFNNEMQIDLFGSFKIARAVAKKAMLPAERYGNEGELDTAAIFLASPCSSYVTGIMVPVDGGYTCM
jgi:NAD(P)-dependent dehydrogenase (short-subunit alcohol dehydrogenase family)